MKIYAILATVLAAIAAFLGIRRDAVKKERLKREVEAKDAKIVRLETKDRIDEISDDDVTATLSEWVRPDNK